MKGDWYKVDNVANVFLATMVKRDTRSLRVSITLKEDIKKDILQEAAEETALMRPQINVRIHRGLFWHYMEETDLVPIVEEEQRRVCPKLYEKYNEEGLHYLISFHEKRINLDMLHVLGDGYGGIDFVNLLLFNYLKRAHPNEVKALSNSAGPSKWQLSENSFENIEATAGKSKIDIKPAFREFSAKLPFDQLQFIEVQMPSSEIRSRAKALDVTVTSLLGSALVMALIKNMPLAARKMHVSIEMPVNLRSYYPTDSIRNFFSDIKYSRVPTGDESLASLSKEYDLSIKESLTPEKISAQIAQIQAFQNNNAIRLVPLFLKQGALRFFSFLTNSGASAVLSNLGRMSLPKEMEGFVDYYSMYCSSHNLFFCVNSFKDNLVIGITNPYLSTGVVRDFVRIFSSDGVPVRVFATEVIR
ncbi:MAG: hypothetical protein ILP08_09000 [Lachnospiraceae bacterium]|nr:hypothetical protein [Lachnospiraceae bacterium]